MSLNVTTTPSSCGPLQEIYSYEGLKKAKLFRSRAWVTKGGSELTMSDDLHVDKYMSCTLQVICRPHLDLIWKYFPTRAKRQPSKGVDLEYKYTF